MLEDSLEDYLARIREVPPLEPDEERELAIRVRAGDQDALDLLVRSSLCHVLPIAEELRDQGIARSDLINEGNLGLLRASFRYDEHAGLVFNEFAAGWIRAAMQQAIAEVAGTTRIPLLQPAEGPDGDNASAM